MHVDDVGPEFAYIVAIFARPRRGFVISSSDCLQARSCRGGGIGKGAWLSLRPSCLICILPPFLSCEDLKMAPDEERRASCYAICMRVLPRICQVRTLCTFISKVHVNLPIKIGI